MTKSVKLSRIALATAVMFAGVAIHSNSMAATSKSDMVDQRTGVVKDGDAGLIKKDTIASKTVEKDVPKETDAGRDKGYSAKEAMARQKNRIEQIQKGRVNIPGPRPKE